MRTNGGHIWRKDKWRTYRERERRAHIYRTHIIRGAYAAVASKPGPHTLVV